ncbi:MAG: hypothetical protein LBU32_01380 [Clostridiales bacterium]|jgi:hypothetical protein|nr:hypothetical protein [Clostridiales bacterium]
MKASLTGASNPMVYDLDNEAFSPFYGLTEDELATVLSDNGLSNRLDEFKTWYNGYFYGGRQIYNISSVLSHISALQINPQSSPGNYWANTSGNDILISAMEASCNLETVIALMAGEAVDLPEISNTISYSGVKREDSLLSILYATGCLTKIGDGAFRIPNEEVKSAFKEFLR